MRKVPVYIILKGETEKDYKNAPDEEIVKEFNTYYNVKHNEFFIKSVYDKDFKWVQKLKKKLEDLNLF